MNLIYVLLTFSLLGLFSLFTLKRIKQWQLIKQNLQQVLCIKNFHSKTKKLIKTINSLNQVIIAENIIQLASVFFPTTWLSQKTITQIKKATKKLQTYKIGSYLFDIKKMYQSGCRLDPRAVLTPYKLSLTPLGVKRDSLGAAIYRKKNLKLCHPLNFQIICSSIQLESHLKTSWELKTHHYFLPKKL